MNIKELEQYKELSVAELIELLQKEETANLTEAKERQSNVQKWIEEAIEQRYYKKYDLETNESMFYEILGIEAGAYQEQFFKSNVIEFKSCNITVLKEEYLDTTFMLYDIKINNTLVPITKEEYDSVENSVQALINSHIKNNEN